MKNWLKVLSVVYCVLVLAMHGSESFGKTRAEELVRTLGLKHLNIESGLFKVLAVSDIEVEASDGKSPASNIIYFMLTKETPQNYVQWLYSDDYQVLIEGGPADYYLFYENGRVEKFTMGRDLEEGQQLIVPSPGGTAKAIVLHDSADYLLVGSIVTPAWSPQRARIGIDDSFIGKYAGAADWATPEFMKFLTGPNFGKTEGASGDGLNIRIDPLGQFIWQGMQLTEKQLLIELRNFVQTNKGKPLQISVTKDAPVKMVEKATELAKQAGVVEIEVIQE